MTVEKLSESSETSERAIWYDVLQRVEIVLNVISHMCIGFVTIFMTWFCIYYGFKKNYLHAWLGTIGFSFLMAEAMMTHYNNNALTMNCKRNTKTAVHGVLQVLGGGLGIASSLVKLIPANFKTYGIHGKLGYATFILALISLFTGLVALFSMRLKRILRPLLNKGFHNLLGIATFVLALTTQYYGYETRTFTKAESASFQTLMKSITLISLVLTCIGPLKALYSKIRNIA